MISKRIFTWYLLLNKRLLHKWSFILIVLMAPVIVLCITAMSAGEKGIYSILLYSEDDSVIFSDIVDRLTGSESVIKYEQILSEEDGYARIRNGNADALWIFDSDINAKLEQSASDVSVKPVVTVVERESSTTQMIAREKLYGVLYPYYNYEIYREYVRDELEKGNTVSEEQLKKYYDEEKIAGNLFRRIYSSGESMREDTDYLLMPLRGMLAVWLVLCILVSCIYYIEDRQRGLFDRISTKHNLLVETGYHMVMLITAVIIMSIGIIVSGIGTTFVNELLCLAVFTYTSAGYCMLFRRLCRRADILGVLIPVLVIVMLGLSPVFVSIRELDTFRFLQPVGLYIRAIHSTGALLEMAVYGGILWVVSYLSFDIVK